MTNLPETMKPFIMVIVIVVRLGAEDIVAFSQQQQTSVRWHILITICTSSSYTLYGLVW